MNYIRIIVLLIIGIAACPVTGVCRDAAMPPDSLMLLFNFRQGDDLLLKDYRGNKPMIKRLAQVVDKDSIEQIYAIHIVGSASPEGNMQMNKALAMQRAQAVRNYIYWISPSIDRNLVRVSITTDFCAAWLRAVENDLQVPRRDRVLQILHSDASIATKWANIQLLVGEPAAYLKQNIFPYLRNSISCVVLLEQSASETSEGPTAPLTSEAPGTCAASVSPETSDTPAGVSPILERSTGVQSAGKSDVAGVNLVSESVTERSLTPRKPLFALKTNLLFDVATVLNLELEVPIGQHWSVAGEVIVPWWLWEKKQHCLQLMSGNIEGKYWFGNRQDRPQLTGWFAGLYAGGGYYDLEWSRKGYQGEFFIALGVSGGYAHTINRRGNLRMEYTLGVGYMQTNYRKYEAKFGADDAWHLYRRESGVYKWFGPTRLKVSLVWMVDCTGKGGAK